MARNTTGPVVATRQTEIRESALWNSSWNFHQIRCLVMLATTLHFGRAAKLLNLSQSALSRHIKAMEESFQIELVRRDSHIVALTPAGEALVLGCRAALVDLERGLERANSVRLGTLGELRLGYTDFAISTTLPQILASFWHEFPGVTLNSVQGSTAGMLEAMQQRELDIVFGTGPIHDDHLNVIEVAKSRLVALLPRNHRLSGAGSITMADLREECFIFGNSQHWQHFLVFVRLAFSTAGYEPNTVARAFNSEGLFGLISANLGVTLYPECYRNYYRRGVVMVEVRDLDVEVPIVAVWNKNNDHKPLALFLKSVRRASSVNSCGPRRAPVHESGGGSCT